MRIGSTRPWTLHSYKHDGAEGYVPWFDNVTKVLTEHYFINAIADNKCLQILATQSLGNFPAHEITMAETLALCSIIIFTTLLTATICLRGGVMQPDLDGPPSPPLRPRYRHDADGFARDMRHPIVLLTRLDPNATYSQDSLKRRLERQGIDDDPGECVQLAMSPAAAKRFMANMSRRRRRWPEDLSQFEMDGLESEAFW